MSQIDKLITRFKSIPSDFSFTELSKLLNHFGFEESSKGMTSGSRVGFIRISDLAKINLHKPHNGNSISKITIREIIKSLEGYGDL